MSGRIKGHIPALVSAGFGMLLLLGLAASLFLTREFHRLLEEGRAVDAGASNLRASVRSLRANFLETAQLVGTRLLAPQVPDLTAQESTRLEALAAEHIERALAAPRSEDLRRILEAIQTQEETRTGPAKLAVLAAAEHDPTAARALYAERYLPAQRMSMRLVDEALFHATAEVAGMSTRWGEGVARTRWGTRVAIGLFLLLGIGTAALLTRAVMALVREAAAAARLNSEVMSNSIDVICSMDAHGRFTQVSGGCERTWGYRPEELLGHTCFEFIHPGDVAKTRAAHAALIAGTSSGCFENRYLHRSGACVQVLWACHWSPERQTTFCVAHDNTERKRAEEELSWKTAFLEAQVHSSADGILVVDTKGRKILQNQRLSDLFQIPEKIAQQKDDAAQVHWVRNQVSDPEPFLERVRYLYAHPEETSREEIELKNGSVLDRYSAPVLGTAGNNYGRIWIFRNITEQRRAAAALLDSEHFLQAALDALSSHIAILDEHGTIIAVNRAWNRFAVANNFQGRHRGTGDNYLELCEGAPGATGDEANAVAAGIRAVIAGRSSEFQLEYPCHSPNERRWFLVRVTRFEGAGPVRVVVAHENITSRREAEMETRLNAQRYRSLVEATTAIVWNTPESGEFDSEQPSWTAFTGQSFAELRGYGWLDAIHPDDQAETGSVWAAAVASRSIYEVEHRLRAHDGNYRHMMVRGVPILAEDGQILQWLGVHSDITVRRQAEVALLHAKELAEAANRSKSEFLANMSHEIRTPMNGVLGMTELVLETALTPEQRAYLEMAQTSGQSLLGLINDILDFSKIEAGKLELETIDFSLRESLAHMFKPLVLRGQQKGLELRTEVAADVEEHLIGDPLRLRQILINFSDNALKFTEHGTVVVRVVTDAELPGEQCLHFSVEDTGIGIPLEKQQIIFEAFAQVDGSTTRTYGGTGLGLAIASQLVERMRGKIWIESTPGKGTTFHFTAWFQIASEKRKRALESERETLELLRAPAVRADGSDLLHILLAEDNVINRALATGILGRRGHSLVHAGNGHEALQIAGNEPFDLILMDIQMPEMDGFEATRRIRETELPLGRHTPIIAMTAHAMTGDRERCLQAGMDDYISKPLDKKKLLALLGRIAGRRTSQARAASTATSSRSARPRSLSTQPIFSRKKLLDLLDDDEALLARMVALFEENTPLLLADVRDALDREDAGDLARAAHALLSSLGALGALSTFATAQQLETLGNRAELAGAAEIFTRLESEIAEVHAALADLSDAPALQL